MEAHFVDRQVREALSAILREPDAALVRVIVKRTQDLQLAEVRESLRMAGPNGALPITATVGRPAHFGLQEAPASFEHEANPSSAPAKKGLIKFRELLAAGIIQAPRDIEVTFKGQRFPATIGSDGLIHFDGQTHASPSQVGGMVLKEGQRATTRRSAVLVDKRLEVLAVRGPSHRRSAADQQMAG